MGILSLIPSLILPFLILPPLLWYKVFAFKSSSCLIQAWICASLVSQYLHTHWSWYMFRSSVACCVFGVCANVCTFNCSATQKEFETYLSQFLSWIYLVKCNSLMFCLIEHYLLIGTFSHLPEKIWLACYAFVPNARIDR